MGAGRVSETSDGSLWGRIFATIGDLPLRGQDLSGVDPLVRRRMREIGFVYLCIVGLMPPLAMRYVAMGMAPAAGFMVFTVAATLLVLAWMRRTHDTTTVGVIGCGILFAQVLVSVIFTGGFYGPMISWFYILPIFGAFIVGARVGGVLTLVAVVVTAVFWRLPHMGIELVNGIPPEQQDLQAFINRGTALTGLGVLLVALGSQRRHITGRLEHETRVQRDLRQRADVAQREAEYANEAKNRLLANLSHELRTPLNTIVGYSEMLVEEQEELDGPRTEDVNHILGAAVQLSNLFETLFFLTSLESGSLRVNPTSVTASVVLAELEQELAGRARDKGLAFEVEGDEDLRLETDPMLLRQLLRGLLDNAVKFTREGHVRATASRGEDDSVLFTVEDTGPGMTDEQLARAFEPFSQSELFSKRSHDGLGLGLSLCSHIADRLGATLEVDGSGGFGTTATVRFET